MNKKLFKTGLSDVNYTLMNYSNMMKWLLNQNYSRNKKMAIYESITNKHFKYLHIATQRLKEATGQIYKISVPLHFPQNIA